MGQDLYNRIKNLCVKNNMTISKLESDLGFGNSSIQKWSRGASPSVDKVKKVADYFNVSTDYLLERTDIEATVSDVINDECIISIQRARQNMTPQDKDKMMKMLEVGFDHVFPKQGE